jgi:hypothetical protein
VGPPPGRGGGLKPMCCPVPSLPQPGRLVPCSQLGLGAGNRSSPYPQALGRMVDTELFPSLANLPSLDPGDGALVPPPGSAVHPQSVCTKSDDLSFPSTV